MKIPYDTSRLREVWQARVESDSPSAECPTSGRIWEAAGGELGPAATAEVVEHLATCASCGEAWRLARELTPKAGSGRASATGGRQVGWVALAASLVLATGLAWQLGSGKVEPTERGTAIGIESMLRGGATLPRGRFTLVWKPGPRGARYDLSLMTNDLDLVYQARDLEQSRYQVPAGALDSIAGNSELLWRVEMVLPDGRHIASPAFMVRLE